MTGTAGDETTNARRRARVVTTYDDPTAARRVARAVTPDNTAEMDTTVEGCQVVTTIERDSTSGLQSTVDDYVVNVDVAAQLANQHTNTHDT
ncbi:KEOPS complex subunit Pcc1 [Halovenus marina]|uniref:KEOPS complex subunit Pcc1 n=1 Tax=Halovenus marina TaxID=3396621 RepID=UPI003F574BBC